MGATSLKPENDNSLVDGASEAEAAREVKFEENPHAGPDDEVDHADDPPDAGDHLASQTKTRVDKNPPAQDAIAVEELTTENDDGTG